MSKHSRAQVVKGILQHVKDDSYAEGRHDGYYDGAQVRGMKLDEAHEQGRREAEGERAHWSIYPGFMCIGAALAVIIMGYLI